MDTLNVYVIGTASGVKKVGISADPSARCAALNAAGCRSMMVLHQRTVPKAIARRIEGHAHWLLRSRLRKGEWFSATCAEATAAVDAAVDAEGRGEQAKRPVGRKKQFKESLRVPLVEGTTARLDAVRQGDEDRLSVIREAIERELKRRERLTPKPARSDDPPMT